MVHAILIIPINFWNDVHLVNNYYVAAVAIWIQSSTADLRSVQILRIPH